MLIAFSGQEPPAGLKPAGGSLKEKRWDGGDVVLKLSKGFVVHQDSDKRVLAVAVIQQVISRSLVYHWDFQTKIFKSLLRGGTFRMRQHSGEIAGLQQGKRSVPYAGVALPGRYVLPEVQEPLAV